MTFPNRPYIGNNIPNEPFHSPEVPATFDRLFGSLVPNIQLEPNPSFVGPSETWERPADWLPMPEVTSTDQKFAGLFAVYNTPENFIALYFEGDYTVDWGDGMVETFSSGDRAQHSFIWDDIPSDTLTSDGYRQVIVTVTPQVGSDLTVMDLSYRHDNYFQTYVSTPWLDIAVSMPEAGSGTPLKFGPVDSEEGNLLSSVQRIRIVHAGSMTDFYECFYEFTALRSVEILNSPAAETFEYMFEYCTSLTDVVLSDTSTVIDTSEMFYECYNLRVAPYFDTSSVQYMNYMFEQCYSLVSVPQYDTSSAIETYGMFYECYALPEVPLLNTVLVQYASDMFSDCYSLKTVPLFNFSSLEQGGYMFSDCYSLTEVPLFNFSSLTQMYGMFSWCHSLNTLPAFNVSSVTNFNSFVNSAYALQSAPLTGVSSNIEFSNCLLGRQALVDIFEGLSTVSGSTIDVTNNYGVFDLTPEDAAIATDKGWTLYY